MPLTLESSSTSRWSSWLRSRSSCKATRYLGIDIDTHCVRIAKMGKVKTTSQKTSSQDLRWLGTHQFDLPFDPTRPPPADWVQQVVAHLRERLPRCVNLNEVRASISLPLSWVHYQVVTENDLYQQDCDNMFRASLFQSNAHIAGWPLKRRSGKATQSMIAATSEDAAFQIAFSVGKLGYRVENIFPRGPVLAQAARSLTNIDAKCIVLLQASGGLVLVAENGTCGVCRKLPGLPAADQVLCADGQLTSDNLSQWLSDVASEVEATVAYADREGHCDLDSNPVLLCGDIATIRGVDEVFASLVNRPVAAWCCARKMQPAACTVGHNDPKAVECDAEFATALSLAQQTAAALGADE